MKSFVKFGFVFFLFVGASGCTKEQTDESAPLCLQSVPADDLEWYVGNPLSIEAVCQDDEQLDRFFYALKNKFDSAVVYNTVDLTGTDESVVVSLEVDQNLELGKYTLETWCRDHEGNLSTSVNTEITLRDSIWPTITQTGAFASKGQTIDIVGHRESLDVYKITIRNNSTSENLAIITDNDNIVSMELRVMSDSILVADRSYTFTSSIISYSYLVPFGGYTGTNNYLQLIPRDASGNDTNWNNEVSIQ